MGISVIDPSYLTAKEWTDFMVSVLEQFGNIGRLEDEGAWRDWAVQLFNLPALSGTIVPNPHEFTTWQDWAARFNENLTTVP